MIKFKLSATWLLQDLIPIQIRGTPATLAATATVAGAAEAPSTQSPFPREAVDRN